MIITVFRIINYLHRPVSFSLNSMSDYLKAASVVALLTLIILAPTIQDLLSEEAAKFVDDNESAHDGLPTEWEGKQVICIHFPESSPHDRFSLGVTMIGSDGVEIGVNLSLIHI